MQAVRSELMAEAMAAQMEARVVRLTKEARMARYLLVEALHMEVPTVMVVRIMAVAAAETATVPEVVLAAIHLLLEGVEHLAW